MDMRSGDGEARADEGDAFAPGGQHAPTAPPQNLQLHPFAPWPAGEPPQARIPAPFLDAFDYPLPAPYPPAVPATQPVWVPPPTAVDAFGGGAARSALELAAFTAPTSGSTAASPKQQPPRPVNSFLIFSNQFRKRLQEENKDLTNAQVSRLLGEKWRALSKEVKAKYEEVARNVRADFMGRHPDFKWNVAAEQRKKKGHRGGGPAVSPGSMQKEGRPPSPLQPQPRRRSGGAGAGAAESPAGSEEAETSSGGSPPGPADEPPKRARLSNAGLGPEGASTGAIPSDPQPPPREAIPDYEARHGHLALPAGPAAPGPAYAFVPLGGHWGGLPPAGPPSIASSSSSASLPSLASGSSSSAASSRHPSLAGAPLRPNRRSSIAAPGAAAPPPEPPYAQLPYRRASAGAVPFVPSAYAPDAPFGLPIAPYGFGAPVGWSAQPDPALAGLGRAAVGLRALMHGLTPLGPHLGPAAPDGFLTAWNPPDPPADDGPA